MRASRSPTKRRGGWHFVTVPAVTVSGCSVTDYEAPRTGSLFDHGLRPPATIFEKSARSSGVAMAPTGGFLAWKAALSWLRSAPSVITTLPWVARHIMSTGEACSQPTCRWNHIPNQ